MAIDIVLPSLSAGMQDGLIARWLKAEGERAEKGEVIAEIETDKATMELEAASSGRLGRILIGEGKRAAVNQIIAVLLGDNEDIDDLPARSSAGAVSAPLPEARIAPPAVAYAGTTLGRVAASPLARRMARENGIDPASLMGSGPRGRIVRIDVERATPNASATSPVLPTLTEPVIASSVPPIPFGIGEYEAVSHSGMRRVIARRLVEAKNTIPHFYLTSDCAIDDLLTLRAQMNELRTASGRISINDLVIKAAAVALQTVPDANVIWTEEALLRLKTIDISVAVATEGGLITPVIRDAGSKSVGAISCEISALAARARENRLKPEEYQGGGLSISNLGMYGLHSFSAIVNPPQSCILAIGAAERRPVVRGDNIVPATMMMSTLSIDHRSIDGALGAALLKAFKEAIEEPMRLLL
ncbi:MAG: 2-oxo acid dehydrogenase subunit E2 [Rhizobiaceae bacterium]|nr:2-oxo acid dehydrogenase subunit E2 [Rhizobiaceae bacterium]TXH13272.1 MAG: pyruvate dehydrogenase complex dihydrolipoamide acetyltransferase [Gammaproteobacteria bacterium]